MKTPHNPLPYKTYNPNDDLWDVIAKMYEQILDAERQNGINKED